MTENRGDAPERRPGPPDRWGSLYGDEPLRETGIGAATIREQRRWRRRLIGGGIVTLLVLGLVGYLVAPRWWWNPRDYGDHVGAGAYVDPMPKELRAELDRALPGLLRFVERERGARFPAEPNVIYLGDAAFRRELSSHLAFEQRRFVGGETYDVLGWQHSGDTFNRLHLRLSGTNVEALYADWDGSIYLRGRSITTLARVQLVGLLTESLDDQRFTLASIYGTDAEQDERSAYDALVAGDVRWAMRAYAATLPLGERCQAQAATRLPLDAACPATVRPPAPIRDPISAEISFPEQYGLRFVSQLRAAGGVAAVDGAFRHPPRSSADILSVPHYRLDRSVTPLPFPPHRGKLVDFGTLGGYTLSLVLANGDPQRVARGDEVQGWRGDSFSTYVAGGRSCVTDWVIFDQPAQRDRFLSQAHAAGVTATPRSSANEATLTICSRG